jgi:hypothetical protein
LVALSIASAAVTVLRRRRTRQRFLARVAARVAEVAGMPPPGQGRDTAGEPWPGRH